MKFPILISYAYVQTKVQKERFAALCQNPNVDILLDCGAFSAANSGHKITLDEYCTFLDQWRDKLFAYLALDVVGDPAGTDRNLKEMVASGYKPVPVHVLGDDKRRMDELFELSDYVALAGLKRPGRGHCPKSYAAMKHKWAEGRHVHWLGYVVESMFRKYRPFSTDSSSWSYGSRFGWAKWYVGRGRWLTPVKYEFRHKLNEQLHLLRPELSRLGFTMEDWNNPDKWRMKNGEVRSIPNVATSASWARYVIDCYRFFGTRVFLACGLSGNESPLLSFLETYSPMLQSTCAPSSK